MFWIARRRQRRAVNQITAATFTSMSRKQVRAALTHLPVARNWRVLNALFFLLFREQDPYLRDLLQGHLQTILGEQMGHWLRLHAASDDQTTARAATAILQSHPF